MKIEKLVEKIDYKLLSGSLDVEISDIVYDSRKAEKGKLFVCIVGAVTDGHKYIPQVIEQGISAIVVEKAEEAKGFPEDVTVICVESSRYAMALMSAALFDYPAEKLTTIGITGTKGKTTTTYMIKSVLESAGKKVGLIGTIGVTIGDEFTPAKNTTPESYELHRIFNHMLEVGCQYVVMEVSSQALKLDRTAGIMFDYGVFTNLSEDHVGPAEHASFEEYMYCKSLLFRQCRVGIVNADDEHLADIIKGHTCQLYTYSADSDKLEKVDLIAENIGFINENGRLSMKFSTKGLIECSPVVNIPGRFSVYNSLVSILVSKLCGVDEAAILEGLAKVTVRGRVEILDTPYDFSMIIDFAHNEVSTRAVIDTLMEYHPKRLICVYGGGGNRSRLRRFAMGEVTGQVADLCILTCDNPRNEEISAINADIKIGLARSNGRCIEIEDRKEAIAYAMTHAMSGDMILMLGKGHEDYQEIKGVRYHFEEREAVAEILEEIKAGKRTLTPGQFTDVEICTKEKYKED